MTNRRIVKETCTAIKKNGERCRTTVGLVEGLCSSHRFATVNPEVKVVGKKSGKKKEVKIAQPELGFDYFADVLNDVLTGAPADGSTKFELVNGVAVEIPVEEYAVEVALEAIRKEQEQEYNLDLGRLEITGDIVIPEEVFARYPYLVAYVAQDAVVNKNHLAAYVIKVANMSYLQTGLEFKFLKSQEDEFSAKARQLSEDAHQEYGQHIPLDIRMDIDAIIAEVTDYKNKKAVLMGQIEWFESQQEEEEDWDGMSKDWEKDESNSFEEVVKRHFMGFLGWVEKRYKQIATVCLSLAACLLLLTAVVSTNDGMPAPSHKAPSDTVVTHKPVDKGTAPVVSNKSKNNVPASTVDNSNTVSNNVDKAIHKEELHTVKSGDTLWDMAVKAYGDGSQWTKIYDANKDKLVHDDSRNATDAGHWIHAGQTIVVPGGGN